jgi:hypothetical protein
MPLQGARRGKQTLKTWCLAEDCHGESPEACRALREMPTLTDLACAVSAWHQRPPSMGAVRIVAMHLSCLTNDNTGQPVFPRVTTRKPQSADGAVSHTPPPAFRLSPPLNL